jgi:hypothetical protein
MDLQAIDGDIADLPMLVARRPRARYTICWSAVIVGSLAALATGLVFGLVRVAVAGRALGPALRVGVTLPASVPVLYVLGAFLSFFLGGWIAGRLSGMRRARATALHGFVVWLVTLPILALMAPLGAAHYFGWYGASPLASAWMPSEPLFIDAGSWQLAHVGALNSLKTLSLGLVGGVIGGWMASGGGASARRRRGMSEL